MQDPIRTFEFGQTPLELIRERHLSLANDEEWSAPDTDSGTVALIDINLTEEDLVTLLDSLKISAEARALSRDGERFKIFRGEVLSRLHLRENI